MLEVAPIEAGQVEGRPPIPLRKLGRMCDQPRIDLVRDNPMPFGEQVRRIASDPGGGVEDCRLSEANFLDPGLYERAQFGYSSFWRDKLVLDVCE